MKCLVLAGGVPQPGEPLYDETAGRPKALLDLAGRPMLQWVLDALAASKRIDHVVLVGMSDEANLSFPGRLDRLPTAGNLAQNLFAGIDHILDIDPTVERVAYCWSDIPLATGDMLSRFLDEAHETAPAADVVAGLVRRSVLEGRWPEVREPWLRLRDGTFVAADFGVFDPHKGEAVRGPFETLADQRKSAFRQATTVGLGLLVRYLTRTLTLSRLERTLEERYSVKARILEVVDPELGLDVDGPINLAICRRELAARVGGSEPSPD